MRPSRDPGARVRPAVLASLLALGATAGCEAQGGGPRAPSVAAASVATLEVVVREPREPREPSVVRPAAPLPLPLPLPQPPTKAQTEPTPEVEAEALPNVWSEPNVPGLSFADALRKARGARDAFGRLTPPGTNAKEASMKTWFGQAQTFVDQASRMYAASFHAPDASREGRIDAISEAAELAMTMARSLDEAGLGALPVAWRADPAIASSFEDIAIGPTRRWRDEARVLAKQCIETARDSGVLTDSARRCATLRTGTPLKTKLAPAANGGCACSPGDPLCSASLGGWCGATH
jgi:hypothetical protein